MSSIFIGKCRKNKVQEEEAVWKKIERKELDVVVHTWNPSAGETKGGEL